jgi:uncharacterized protein YcsI (UPF0317 family)
MLVNLLALSCAFTLPFTVYKCQAPRLCPSFDAVTVGTGSVTPSQVGQAATAVMAARARVYHHGAVSRYHNLAALLGKSWWRAHIYAHWLIINLCKPERVGYGPSCNAQEAKSAANS